MAFGLVSGRSLYRCFLVASVCVIVLSSGALIAQRRVSGQLRSPSSPAVLPPAGLYGTRAGTLSTSTGVATDLGATVNSLDGIAFTPAGTTAANVALPGRVLTASGSGLRGVTVALDDGTTVRTAITNAFGY